MEADEFEVKTKVFLSWLSRMGIVMNHKMEIVDLRGKGRGRGVVAVADFEEDELIASIPRSAVLNIKTALGTSTASFPTDNILDMPNWLALTTIMLDQSLREDSKWAPYLAILPRQLDNLVFWSDSELSELQASKVLDKIGKASAEDIFSKCVVPLRLANCNIEECHRIASIIMSYAFDIPETNAKDYEKVEEEGDGLISDDEEEEKTILSMIPLADMLNADADRNNARLCCDNEHLELRTIKPIIRGEEIFNDYGQLPRSDLLRRYGYVTQNYELYDVVEISTRDILSLFGSGEIFNRFDQSLKPLNQDDLGSRIELAEREGILEGSYDLSYPGPEGPSIPDELLALIYLILLNEQSLKALYDSDALPSRSKLATELVGKVLVALLQLRENEYATSLEEDEELIRAGDLPHRIAMAVEVRHGEKSVLRAAIKEARTFTASNKRMRLEVENNSVGEGAKGKRSIEEAIHPKKKGRFN